MQDWKMKDRSDEHYFTILLKMKKSAQRRRKHCALAVVKRSQIFSLRRRPPSLPFPSLPFPFLPGRPKFNQLEMVLYLQTQFGEDRCTQFRVIVVTDPQTNTQTQKQTGAITIHYAAKLSAQYY